MQTIHVPLGNRSYPIHLGHGILPQIGQHFVAHLGHCAAAIVTDDNVAPLYLKTVQQSLDQAGIPHFSLILPHGEETKCIARLQEIYSFLSECGITRSDALIALGGGVIGDLTGLAAATWLRGIRFMQVPTTLLSQVDSSVGGKVAVDLPQGKNLVGAFWQPSIVLVDADVLQTLTDHYWRDGLGEVVKYGCICNASLFQLLEGASSGGRYGVMAHIDEILTCCIQAKADVVAQDETDRGLRATLNFGHTIGHAIEAEQHYNGVSHGEGVAIGMARITEISERLGLTSSGTASRIIHLLSSLGLPTDIPQALTQAGIISAMSHDKKNSGDTLTIILLKEIGTCYLHKTTRSWFEGNL